MTINNQKLNNKIVSHIVKIIITALLIVVLLLFFNINSSFEKEEEDIDKKDNKKEWDIEKGHWVYYNDGKKLKNAWLLVDGDEFYFDKDAYMVSLKKLKIGDDEYIFNAFGYKVKNSWVRLVADYYYVDKEGKVLKNTWVDNDSFYLIEDGRMLTDEWVYKVKKDDDYKHTNNMTKKMLKEYYEVYKVNYNGLKIMNLESDNVYFDGKGKASVLNDK